ncbi:hypothetical protein HY418_00255 [Candidatus Kaiserbacteria bacterium]|nr:hypothetical protein [Candidatus Kaiserbacteria bacterium]
MAKAIIIGTGKIGTELRKQLEAARHEVLATVNRHLIAVVGKPGFQRCHGDVDEAVQVLGSVARDADAVMLAIANTNHGDDELQYMEVFRDKRVVTCAKAGHAYQYLRVLALGQPIGRRAIVGGGTDMLEILRRRQLANENLILDAVVNGTLNHIWHGVQGGGSPIGAIGDAKALGYAEPGSTDNVAILNGELDDLCMKAAILHNVVLSDGEHFLTPNDFKVFYLKSEEDIHRLSSRNVRCRFILTFSSVKDYDELPEGNCGSLRAQCGRWHICGDFHNVGAETPWFDWLREMGDVMNGFRISPRSKDGPYSFVGPGAGPEVTAKAMVRDLHDLLAA